MTIKHVCGHCSAELATATGRNWAALVCVNPSCGFYDAVHDIRTKLAREPHPYTDVREIRVLLASIDVLEAELILLRRGAP